MEFMSIINGLFSQLIKQDKSFFFKKKEDALIIGNRNSSYFTYIWIELSQTLQKDVHRSYF